MLRTVRDSDISLLRVFVAVAESGGIAAAQARLNTAPSTISTQLSDLETRLGLRLCQRGRAGFALTREGRLVLNSAYRLLTDLGRFTAEVAATQDQISGTLRILIVDGISDNADLRLPDAIRSLRRDYPLLHLDIALADPDAIGPAILKGEADVALAWLPLVLPSLSVEVLFHEEEIICCGRGHPLFDRAPDDLTIADLEGADWARELFHTARPLPFARPPVSTATTNFIEGLLHLVLAGTHIAYLPRASVRRWIEAGQVRPLLPGAFTARLPISLVSRSDLAAHAGR